MAPVKRPAASEEISTGPTTTTTSATTGTGATPEKGAKIYKKHRPSGEDGKKKVEPPKNRREQKDLRNQRKMEKSPVYETIHELKKIWETVRMKRTSKSDRYDIIAKAMVLAKGNIMDLIFKHDASRVVQSLLKFSEANKARPQLLEEMQTHYVELAQSPYGRFVVLKALKYAPNAAWRSKIIAEFCQHKPVPITKLIRHKFADVVVDTIYCLYANAKERQTMVEYFYGSEYLILKKSAATLLSDNKNKNNKDNGSKRITLDFVLEQFPEKRTRIVTQLKDRLLSMVGKEGTIGRNEILHRVFYELFANHSLTEVVEMVAAPTAPFHGLLSQVPTFVHTKPGSQLAMVLLGAVGAKERKSMLKSMKPHAKEMASNEFGWMVLARVTDCVDDTVLVKNCIFSELLGKDAATAAEVLKENHVRRLFVYLLGGQSTKYFSPDLIAALNVRKEFLVETAKKDAALRRQEHLAAFVPRCVSALEESPKVVDTMMREMSGCQFLFELMKQSPEVSKSVARLLANPLIISVEEEAEEEKGLNAVEEESSDDEMIEEVETTEDAEEETEQGAAMEEDDAEEEEEDEEEGDDGEAMEEDTEEAVVEEETELAVSKNYLDTAEKPEKLKVHMLVDQLGTRFLKKYCQELSGFADTMADAVLEHGLLEELAAAHETQPLPTGPFFVLVSILEHCQDAGKRKTFANRVQATMQAHMKDTEHKGLVCLRGVLEQQQAPKKNKK